jgi:hypothetical protein
MNKPQGPIKLEKTIHIRVTDAEHHLLTEKAYKGRTSISKMFRPFVVKLAKERG